MSCWQKLISFDNRVDCEYTFSLLEIMERARYAIARENTSD